MGAKRTGVGNPHRCRICFTDSGIFNTCEDCLSRLTEPGNYSREENELFDKLLRLAGRHKRTADAFRAYRDKFLADPKGRAKRHALKEWRERKS